MQAAKEDKENKKEKATAIFGGGCFWCTEAVFKMLRGVLSVEPGYVGGTEVVKIEYDTAAVGYRDLLTVFFGSHDPTSLNRQGNDVGTEYRSVIFYTTPEQKRVAEDFIKEINESNSAGKSVVTAVEPLGGVAADGGDGVGGTAGRFFPAEDYHRDYYAKNSGANAYCELVINPKLEKVKQKFATLLDEIYAAK